MLQSREVRCEELVVMCQQKDQMVRKLQTTMDKQTEATTKDVRQFLFCCSHLHWVYHVPQYIQSITCVCVCVWVMAAVVWISLCCKSAPIADGRPLIAGL